MQTKLLSCDRTPHIKCIIHHGIVILYVSNYCKYNYFLKHYCNSFLQRIFCQRSEFLRQDVTIGCYQSALVLPSGTTSARWSVLGQDSLFHIASVYPAAKWVPSIDKAVLRACALYAAICFGISLGD